jgi:hypothetical protein
LLLTNYRIHPRLSPDLSGVAMDLERLLQQRSLAWEALKRAAVSLAAIDVAISKVKEKECSDQLKA